MVIHRNSLGLLKGNFVAKHTIDSSSVRYPLLDWVRLFSMVGIIAAHSYGTLHGYAFWLANDIAPLLFVALIGITSQLTHKNLKQLYIYAGWLIAIGLILSVLSPFVITVLPTLAVVMIALHYIPPGVVWVIGSYIVALVATIVSWVYGLTGYYTLDVINFVIFPPGSLYAFFFSGTYALTQWLAVALTARCAWVYREKWLGPIYTVCGDGVSRGLFIFLSFSGGFVGWVHLQHHSFADNIMVFTPARVDGFSSLSDILSSPHTHAGSIAVLAYGVVFIISIIGLSYRPGSEIYTPRVAQAALSLYVISVMLQPLLHADALSYLIVVVCSFSSVYVSILWLGRGPVELLIQGSLREYTEKSAI